MPKNASLIDVYPEFADSSHRWREGLTVDGTHFSRLGYQKLAIALRPAIEFLNRASTFHSVE